jgi:hypothetical protein
MLERMFELAQMLIVGALIILPATMVVVSLMAAF